MVCWLSAGFAGVPVMCFWREGRNNSACREQRGFVPANGDVLRNRPGTVTETYWLVNMPISGQMKKTTAHPVCMT